MSSANKNDSECFNEDGTLIRNKSGPSKLPWGTPEITGRVDELELLIQTRWYLLDR